MPLSAGAIQFKNALLQMAARQNEDQGTGEALDEYIQALETFIKSAQVNVTVQALGLAAPNGPVTGTAQGTGTLS